MNDRFRYRLVFKKTYRTINGNFDGYEIYYCNGFIRTKNKIEFKSKNKRYNFYSCSLKSIDQCTGLKDKNGKLIYEGDIVRFRDCNNILVINYQKEMACFAPQFYCNGKYGGRLWFDDYDSSECQFYKSNNFEVIGNIYKNKELLESEG